MVSDIAIMPERVLSIATNTAVLPSFSNSESFASTLSVTAI